jgi:hypothetical protein
MPDAGCRMPDSGTKSKHATFGRIFNAQEKAINRLSSRPSLSSLLRGEKVTVPKPIGLILEGAFPQHPASSIQHLSPDCQLS